MVTERRRSTELRCGVCGGDLQDLGLWRRAPLVTENPSSELRASLSPAPSSASDRWSSSPSDRWSSSSSSPSRLVASAEEPADIQLHMSKDSKGVLLYSTVLYSLPLYPTLLHFILFSSTLLCSMQPFSSPLCIFLFYYTLVCTISFYPLLLYSIIFYARLVDCILFSSTPPNPSVLYSI